MKQFEEWEGFKGRIWKEEINTRDFIQENYTPYDGDESFLAGSTEATDKLWGILQGLQKEERKKGGQNAYLQVVEGNDNARALYRSLGFQQLYTYWFRVQPDENGNFPPEK